MAGTYWLYESSVFENRARVLIHIGRILGVTSRALFRDDDSFVSMNKDRKEYVSVDTAILLAFDEGYLQPGLVVVSTAPCHNPTVVPVLVASMAYPTTPKIGSAPSHAPLVPILQGAFLELGSRSQF